MWKYYALLSALFAALTAVFAKVGVKEINSDLATAIRTSVILFITWGIVFAGNHTAEVKGISGHTWIFLILSGVLLQGIAGRGCIACGADRQIERGDYHLSLLSVSERAGQPAGYHRGIAHYGW